MRWERSATQTRTESGKLTGFTKIEGRTWGPDNTAKWTIHENQRSLRGIPKLLRVAVLLKRTKEISNQQFLAWVRIDTEVSGLSLGNVQSSFLRGEKDDPIIFDPAINSEPIEGIQLDMLSNVDLSRLVDVTLESPEFVTHEDVLQDEMRERDTWRDAEVLLEVELVGDDLLCTNVERVRLAEERTACNSMLLKVNQIGTVSESIEA